LRQLCVRKIEDTGMDHRQVTGIFPDCVQRPGGTDNRFDIVSAIEQLLYQKTPGCTACADDQDSHVLSSAN
jgi:hypothetical protein